MTTAALQLTTEQYIYALSIAPSPEWQLTFRIAGHFIADLEKQGLMSPKLLDALVGAAWRTAELTNERRL